MTSAGSWYHCSVKPVSRSSGRSAVAAAAYRSGERLHDDRTQQVHDYTSRSGVESTFIVAPENSPDWAREWGSLWNHAEAAEKRSNSQTAREVELALPSAVDGAERETIARQLAEHLSERYGVAVAVALHEPSKQGDERNHHAHILMTTRRIDGDGLGAKTRELDDQKTGRQEVRHIREYAADLINASLERHGIAERVDHRSFKDRGLEQVPQERLEMAEIAIERRGEKTRRGDKAREIAETNQRIKELAEQRTALDGEIAKEQEPKPEPEAENSGSYWQNRIKAEREARQQGAVGKEETPIYRQDEIKAEHDQGEPPPPQSVTEQQAAQSAFDDPLVKIHEAQILESGAIKHHGLVMTWVEHAIDYGAELVEGIKDKIISKIEYSLENKWQDYVKERERERLSNPDKDGIDFDR